jgi:YD repeat-containing protein
MNVLVGDIKYKSRGSNAYGSNTSTKAAVSKSNVASRVANSSTAGIIRVVRSARLAAQLVSLVLSGLSRAGYLIRLSGSVNKMRKRPTPAKLFSPLVLLLLAGAALAEIKIETPGCHIGSGSCDAYRHSSGPYWSTVQAACDDAAAAYMASTNSYKDWYSQTYGKPVDRVISSFGVLGDMHWSGSIACRIDANIQRPVEWGQYGGYTSFGTGISGTSIYGYKFHCNDLNSETNVAVTNGTVQAFCTCNEGYTKNPANDKCAILLKTDDSKRPLPQEICTSNPIFPLTGVKREFVDTGLRIGGIGLTLAYDSTGKILPRQGGVSLESISPNELGALWKSSFHRRLQISVGSSRALLSRGDGRVLNFSGNGAGLFTADVGNASKLITITGGYLFTDASSGDQEVYDAAGKLTSISTAQGMQLNFGYLGSNLTQVEASDGRKVVFAYVDDLISQIADPNGGILTVTYDTQRNLAALTRQDGKTQQFLYENPSLPWALTGKVDENNSRYATFTYDAQGRAITGEHAGGVGKVSIAYEQAPELTVVDNYDSVKNILYRRQSWQSPTGTTLILANGQTNSLGAVSLFGMPAIASQSQPAGSGCAASTNAIAYDANANITSRDDFAGNRTCYAYDAKNQETTRVEGLATSVECATVLPANATLPANARKTSTSYHPDWRLPAVIAGPGSITNRIYQGRPDPFSGNQVANCTAAPNMPNGKPLPVLCKQVIQATLPSGALDTTTPNTTSSYSYDAAGRILTSTDSLSRTTSYAYYSATAFTGADPNAVGHTIGDLQSITNPAGHITTFDSYDKTGRILQTTDPKGVVTVMSYTPRGWISTVTTTAPGQTARTTRYSYDGVGQLTGVSHPDGSTLSYSYDAAHRLVGVTDAKGNSMTYTLDNMGNRIKEDIKDPTGVLQRSINRSFDALNRVQQVTGAAQ